MRKVVTYLLSIFTIMELVLFVLNCIPDITVNDSKIMLISITIIIVVLILAEVFLICNSKKKKIDLLNRITFGDKKQNMNNEIVIKKEDENLFRIYCNTLLEI